MSKKESQFQKDLIAEIKERFPGAFIFKNDSGYKQGVPDLTVLYNDRWSMLECKADSKAKHQPNQDYYVEKLNEMSHAAFIFPENKEEVLDEMERSFRSRRKTRISKRK